MYGRRGRIGLLVPSVNTVVEPEMNRMALDGINFYAARMRNSRSDVEDSKAMLAHVERAADELASANMDVIAFACTASSFVEGPEGESRLKKRIEAVAGIPAVTTSGAVADALKALGVRKFVMATPYTNELNMLERDFLEDRGFQILKIEGMGIIDAFSIGKVEPESAYQFAKGLWDTTADATFISCTNLRTIDIITKLENDTGRPVVTSNQATFWACLKTLGYREPIKGYGTLLEQPRRP